MASRRRSPLSWTVTTKPPRGRSRTAHKGARPCSDATPPSPRAPGRPATALAAVAACAGHVVRLPCRVAPLGAGDEQGGRPAPGRRRPRRAAPRRRPSDSGSAACAAACSRCGSRPPTGRATGPGHTSCRTGSCGPDHGRPDGHGKEIPSRRRALRPNYARWTGASAPGSTGPAAVSCERVCGSTACVRPHEGVRRIPTPTHPRHKGVLALLHLTRTWGVRPSGSLVTSDRKSI